MKHDNAQDTSRWTIADSEQLYRLDRWGKEFFSIGENGEMLVHSNWQGCESWNLVEIIRECEKKGLEPPLLIRFKSIIAARLQQLNQAFESAISEFEYAGRYQCVYPVKVNQHREVIDAYIEAAQLMGGGLEAGSKAELLAVISLAGHEMPILCNGFKDESIIEMALRATQIGRQVTIILEKAEDAENVVRLAQRLNVRPKLGLRVKLAARSAGRWQGSVGPKSKFGLNSVELESALSLLQANDLLDRCQLLHFHPGSQINSIRNIKACIIEATRIYADLLRRGVPIATMDVGGGLGVDYTGDKNTRPSSMNYTLQEYANDVIYYIQMICQQEQIRQPDVISESGRALVAHHSVLVVPVISTSSHRPFTVLPQLRDDEVALPLIELRDIIKELDEENMQESFHDAQQAIEMAHQLFINGHLTLNQRSHAEEMFSRVCRMIRDKVNNLDFVPAELAELRNLFAEVYLANFSVFQSLPDHWAMDHLFPIMPIHRLDERPTCNAMIGDITCDSDGKIGRYVGDDKSCDSMPLHRFTPDTPYWLGIFLVGAYQEALSDDHNLFGKFHVITLDDSESWQTGLSCKPGSTLRYVLEHVHHDCKDLLHRLDQLTESACSDGRISKRQASEHAAYFRQCSREYTYLSGSMVKPAAEPAADPTATARGPHMVVDSTDLAKK